MKTLYILIILLGLSFSIKILNQNEVTHKSSKEDVNLIFSQIHKKGLDTL